MVFGPCFQPNDSVNCSFGGISTPGIFVSRERVMCVSPAMDIHGRVEVTVEIRDIDGNITFQGKSLFHSGKCELHWFNQWLSGVNGIMVKKCKNREQLGSREMCHFIHKYISIKHTVFSDWTRHQCIDH